MLKKILLTLAVIIIGFVIVVAVQPADFTIQRSATISAPPAVIFAQVNDLHKMQDWSPFAKIDPAAKTTYEGAPSGTGASFTWSGNAQAGAGRMTITDSRPGELVQSRLEFTKPFEATNTVQFTFQPQGNQTVVTWSMSGRNGFLGKAIGLFMNCDKMVGTEFEKGLADLKTLSEGLAKQ